MKLFSVVHCRCIITLYSTENKQISWFTLKLFLWRALEKLISNTLAKKNPGAVQNILERSCTVARGQFYNTPSVRSVASVSLLNVISLRTLASRIESCSFCLARLSSLTVFLNSPMSSADSTLVVTESL